MRCFTGDLVGQAVARYDFIVQKYGIATFANFIDRTLPPSGAPLLIVSEKEYICRCYLASWLYQLLLVLCSTKSDVIIND